MADLEQMSIEEGFIDMEGIITQLESTDISLEDAFHLYEQGMHLVKACNDKIDRVEKQVLQINAQTMELSDFE